MPSMLTGKSILGIVPVTSVALYYSGVRAPVSMYGKPGDWIVSNQTAYSRGWGEIVCYKRMLITPHIRAMISGVLIRMLLVPLIWFS